MVKRYTEELKELLIAMILGNISIWISHDLSGFEWLRANYRYTCSYTLSYYSM